MVVLSGEELLDLALRNEIKSRWRVSPFDFCYEDQIPSIKNNPNFYILYMNVEKSSLVYLSLEKCGDNSGASSLNSAMKVLKTPFSPKDFTTGREISYLSAMIDIIQHYVEDAILEDYAIYSSLFQRVSPLSKGRHKKIYIAREDVSIKDSLLVHSPGIVFADSYTVDSLFTAGSPDALIGFCVSSSAPSKKAESYQIIVSADRHELLYYKREKYTEEKKRGFSLKALKEIKKEHKYRP